MKETDILSNIKGHHPVRIRTPTVTSSTKKNRISLVANTVKTKCYLSAEVRSLNVEIESDYYLKLE